MTFKARSSMGCAAMMAVLFSSGQLRGFECFECRDDFEDGDIMDGDPCSWVMVSEGGFCAGTNYVVENGQLILGEPDYPPDYVGTYPESEGILTGDVTVQFQATATGTGGLTAWIHAQNCSGGDGGYAQVWFPSGEVYYGYKIGVHDQYGMKVLDPPPALEEFLVLRMDFIGNVLQIRIWRPDEEIPKEPFIKLDMTMFTDAPQSGKSGVNFRPLVAGSGAEGIFEYVWIIEGALKAEMTVDPESGTAPLKVTVDGSTSSLACPGHDIVSYEWEFGDGEVAEKVQASHTYAEAGRYTIQLTVTDDRGLSGSAEREILMNCPPGDTSPWQVADIGQPKFPGAFQKEGDCLEVCAGGTGITSIRDQLSFAYLEFQGDFVLTVEVTELETQQNGAGVSLMARESLDPTAKMAAISLEKLQDDFVPHLRTRPSSIKTGTALGLPVWLQLERSGDEFIGSVSPDGTTWTEVDRVTVDLPENVLVGIAGFGKDPGTGSASFQALRAKICWSPIPLFRRGDANSDGKLDISDPVFVLGYLFLGGKEPSCLKTAEANADGKIDISDAVYLLGFLFLGGGSPQPPYPDCGLEPAGGISCDSYPPALCP